MVEVICGKKGSGKTKRMIALANQSVGNSKGNIIFIDDDTRYIYDLERGIRFINASEYDIKEANAFIGFLNGLRAQDFDLQVVFIDGFLKILDTEIFLLSDFFKRLQAFAKANDVRVVVSVSGDAADMPEYVKELVIS